MDIITTSTLNKCVPNRWTTQEDEGMWSAESRSESQATSQEESLASQYIGRSEELAKVSFFDLPTYRNSFAYVGIGPNWSGLSELESPAYTYLSSSPILDALTEKKDGWEKKDARGSRMGIPLLRLTEEWLVKERVHESVPVRRRSCSAAPPSNRESLSATSHQVHETHHQPSLQSTCVNTSEDCLRPQVFNQSLTYSMASLDDVQASGLSRRPRSLSCGSESDLESLDGWSCLPILPSSFQEDARKVELEMDLAEIEKRLCAVL